MSVMSGCHDRRDGTSARAKSSPTEKHKNRIMLREKLAVISSRFFLDSVAWWAPNVHSIFPKIFLEACFEKRIISVLPDTAATGETLEARLAGACAASRTVTIPTKAPLIKPMGLRANTGVNANSPPIP